MSSFARKIKRQAERQGYTRALQALRDDTISMAPELFEQKKIKFGRTHGKKLSEALLDVIQPYKAMLKVNTLTQMHNLVLMGVAAWAVAIGPEPDRPRIFRNMVDTFPDMSKAVRADFEEILWGLVERKLALFPNDQRVIINAQVVDEGGDWHVTAASLERE